MLLLDSRLDIVDSFSNSLWLRLDQMNKWVTSQNNKHSLILPKNTGERVRYAIKPHSSVLLCHSIRIEFDQQQTSFLKSWKDFLWLKDLKNTELSIASLQSLKSEDVIF